MAPELLPPARPRYGVGGDIWACGVIAYVLLAGNTQYTVVIDTRTPSAVIHSPYPPYSPYSPCYTP